MVLASQAIAPGTGHAAGQALLNRMYREYTGRDMPPILTADRGKPYWKDSPLHFSISHTRHHVFCAIAENPVGIDAEALDRDIDLRLAEKILSPGELAQYRGAEDPRLALLTFWVLKEAQAKATGEGLRGYPNRTDFSLHDPRVSTVDNCLVAVIEMIGKRENTHEGTVQTHTP